MFNLELKCSFLFTFNNKFKPRELKRRSCLSEKHWNKKNKVTLYLPAVSFFILWEVNSVQTVRYIILCHPLIRVLSSLGTNSDYFGCSPEVDLQPLVPSVVFWGPGPHEIAAATVMKAGEISAVVRCPYGRGCDHMIFKTARLHSHWSVTEWTYDQKENRQRK